jgi:lysozyme family protein
MSTKKIERNGSEKIWGKIFINKVTHNIYQGKRNYIKENKNKTKEKVKERYEEKYWKGI